jgi:hypothetical protein
VLEGYKLASNTRTSSTRMTEEVGDFEYNPNDLIGHGAFAVVFKGRKRKVSTMKSIIFCIFLINLCYDHEGTIFSSLLMLR